MQPVRLVARLLMAACTATYPFSVLAQTIQTIGVSEGLVSASFSGTGRYVATFVRTQATGNAISILDRDASSTQTYTASQLRPTDLPSTSTLMRMLGVSDDGRYLAYLMTVRGVNEQALVRLDRTTNTREVVLVDFVSFYEGPGASMSRDGQVFAWVNAAGDVVRRQVGAASAVIGRTCVMARGTISDRVPCAGTAMSADGAKVAFGAPVVPEPPGHVHWGFVPSLAVAVAVFDAPSNTKTYFPEAHISPIYRPGLVMNTDGTFVGFTHAVEPGLPLTYGMLDVTTRRVESFSQPVKRIAQGGTYVVLDATIYDRIAGRSYAEPAPYSILDITPTLRLALVSTPAGDSSSELAVADYDSDQDGIFDLWESAFGLSPANAADASQDFDGDGASNAAEFATRSHPTAPATATRVFAEGAAGSFFDTVVSVFNPGDQPVETVVRFLGADGSSASRQTRLGAKGRVDWASCCIPTLTAAEFGIVVESTAPVVADRTMTWDRVTGYGAHAATAADGAHTTWYFAEGATIAGFQTFYLLSNPAAVDASVTISYFLNTATVAHRTHVVPAGGRLTVWVNQEGSPLDQAEFSASITASAPIVAERAMYRGGPSGAFTAGSDSMGITQTSTTWHFAEGSTGSHFDTFLLVANPGPVAGMVSARYGLPDGSVVVKDYPIAAQSRLTVWVDQEDALLASTAFSTTLTSSVPTVAERAMWWPGDGATWTEVHTEAGAPTAARTWAAAGGQVSTAADTFFLVLNTSETDSTTLTVTIYGGITLSRQIVAPANSRTTLWMRDLFPELNGHFSTVISSSAAPIVVERAVYTNAFEAGTALRATPLP